MNGKGPGQPAITNTTTTKGSGEPGIVSVFLREQERFKCIIAGMGLNRTQGEDILQNVSIEAMQYPRDFPNADEAVRWLTKVTVNRCLLEYRNKQRFDRKASEILERRKEKNESASGADEKAIVAEELDIVRETLRELDESVLMVMVLRYFCDLTSEEIGAILHLNPSTVRNQLRDGRITLAKRLLERGIER